MVCFPHIVSHIGMNYATGRLAELDVSVRPTRAGV
jgi:hypothetical protein